jgi:hypothetical protein
MTYAGAAYDSIAGKIESCWRIDCGEFELDVTIPANTTATIYIPASDAESVLESGWPASTAEGVRPVGMQDETAVFQVGSGQYRFVSKYPY